MYNGFEDEEEDRLTPSYMKFPGVRDLPPLHYQPLPQGKLIHVYRDDDRHKKSVRILVNPRSTKTFNAILDEIHRKVKPPTGYVRSVFTPEGGTRVTDFQHFQDDHMYVASTKTKYKAVSESIR